MAEKIQLDPKTKAVLDKKGYEVQEKISEGAFGQVYRAWSVNEKKMAAVKVMDLDKMQPKFRDHFLPRELQMLQTIKHPYVLEVWDIFKMARHIYIFMEFAPNGSLTSRLKGGKLSEPVAKKWFRQIAEALYHIHCMHIAHRDIKSDNVLLDAKENAKLCDYGFAREVEVNEMSKTLCGTAPYYCPEMIETRTYDPFKADTWAMGVLLFVMLTAKFPFRYPSAGKPGAEEWKTMVDAQKKGLYRERPEFHVLSDAAKDLIYRLLHPNYKARLESKRILKHKWTFPQ